MKFGNAAWGWTPIPEDMPEGDSPKRIAKEIRELGFEAVDYLGTPEALDSYFSAEIAKDRGTTAGPWGWSPTCSSTRRAPGTTRTPR